MNLPLELIEAQVMQLAHADRVRLLEALMESLDHDVALDQAWAEEADLREQRIARGESQWLDGDEVMRRLKASLG